MKQITIGFAALTLLFGACAEGPRSTTDDFGYEGTGIEFKIAPLTLDSLSDACYSFAIKNGSGQLVVGRGPGAAATNVVSGNPDAVPPIADVSLVAGTAAQTVCASQFGNGAGGDISYVAPCDADLPSHTVTLWVDALCTSGAPLKTGKPNWSTATAGTPICTEMQAYVNPCGEGGCNLTVTCAENQDTPVTFNFTIMAQADQGFFDIAVNFDDVFCSAKLDTCGTDNQPIRLVFDAAGNRMDTVVLAVSCTAGPGTADTHLTHTQLEVSCENGAGTVVIGGDIPTIHTAEGNFTHNDLRGAAYFGTESLPGANKVYSNFAFGIPTGFTCDIAWQVIPTNGPFVQPDGANTYNSFGYVNFNAENVPPGSVECKENRLNARGSAVTTVYASTNDTGTLPPVSHIGLGDDAIAAASGEPPPPATLPAVFVTIQAGTFVMGSPDDEVGRGSDETQVMVTLTRNFYLAESEVTQGQWKAISGGTNPSCYQTAGNGSSCTSDNKNDTAPVERVSWWSVIGYANALSVTQGFEPCFTLPENGCRGTWQAGDLDCGDQEPAVTGGNVYDCAGYRLPTEAEWEYAARAGTATATYGGNLNEPIDGCVTLSGVDSFPNNTPLADLGWYDCENGTMGKPTYGTKEVKKKAANTWGLYDMLGNVFEWTWDSYALELQGGKDPQWTVSDSLRVLRGGVWGADASVARAAFRTRLRPVGRGDNLGFRVSRTVP